MVSISTQSLRSASLGSITQTQADLSKVQQEISSGKKADVGLSLGANSGQVLSLNLEASRLQSYSDNNALAVTRLTSTSSAISTLQTTAASFLSTLTSANPDSTAISAVLATAKSNLSAMSGALNTSIDGQYIFGGINTDTPPSTDYTTDPPSAGKQAVDASFQATFGFSQTSPSATSITADQMQSYLDNQFSQLFTPTGYAGTWSQASDTVIQSKIAPSQTADTSVSANDTAFRTLSQAYAMVSEFAGQNLSSAAAQVVLSRASTMISTAMDGLTSLNATVGVAQSAVSDASDQMTSQIGLLTTQSNSLQGVDATALSVSVASLQTQIQASYEITSKLQGLSLVNYMP